MRHAHHVYNGHHYPTLAALPSDGEDGDVCFLADGMYQHVAGSWQAVGSGASPAFASLENKDSVTLPEGTPVAGHGSGSGMIRAQADAPATISLGLLLADTAVGFSGEVMSEGQFELADWTAITGTPSLAALGTYFLDPTTPGQLTVTPPSAVGQVVQVIGRALSPTILDLSPSEPILL